MKAARLLPVLAVVVGLVGCRPQMPTTLLADRMVQDEFGYAVTYVGGDASAILGEDWRLDNYVWLEASARKPQWVQKRGPGYVVNRSYDLDGYGERDWESRNFPVYDLRLTHRHTDGVVWLRSHPLSAELKDKELRVLAQRFVDASSFTRTSLVQLDEGDGPIHAVEERWAAVLRSGQDCKVAGAPAYRADFEVYDVDRAQAGGKAPQVRVALVLVDPGFVTLVGPPDDQRGFDTVLVAGYSNRPEDFDADAPDFEALLQHVSFSEREPGETTCTAPAPPTAQPEAVDAVEPVEPIEEAPPDEAAPDSTDVESEQ